MSKVGEVSRSLKRQGAGRSKRNIGAPEGWAGLRESAIRQGLVWKPVRGC